MPTIRDIARKAGVSHTVVSAILHGGNSKVRYSEATKRKVLKIVRQLGYRPHRGARSLATKSTLTVGISFAWSMSEIYRHPAMAFVLAGVSEALSRSDYSLLVRASPNSEGYLPKPDLFHPNEVDGVLLVGAIRSDDPNLNLWRKSKLPMVLVSTPPEGVRGINCVDIDNFAMVVQAVNFLVGRGYRQIGLVLPGLEYTCHQINLKAFEHALSEKGLNSRRWVWTAGYTPEEGYQFAQKFLAAAERPEALVFLAEMAAIGFGKALLERRIRVPEDLGLVIKEKFPGQMAFLEGVAVIEPPYFNLGYEAAELLVRLLKGELEPPVQKFLPTQISVNSKAK